MKIGEIRERFEERIRFANVIDSELVDFEKSLQRQFEELWKYGYIENFTNDFLAYANGYQINTGDYEDFHILQTLDLRKIKGTKKAIKALGEFLVK